MFRLFRDVHVNFTIFSMMPYDTADKRIRNYDNGFNLTLAQDSLSLLDKASQNLNFNLSVEDIRKRLQTTIKKVWHCQNFLYTRLHFLTIFNIRNHTYGQSQ